MEQRLQEAVQVLLHSYVVCGSKRTGHQQCILGVGADEQEHGPGPWSIAWWRVWRSKQGQRVWRSNAPVPFQGEWVCGVCNANRCWSTCNSCYRCGYCKGVMLSDVQGGPLPPLPSPFPFNFPPLPPPIVVSPFMLDPLVDCFLGLLRKTPRNV